MIKLKLLLEELNKKEMVKYFHERTNRHIELVRKYWDKIVEYDQDRFKELLKRKEIHDKSKFNNPEIEPYVYITWK